MSTFVTLPRCLLSSPLSYGPYLLSIGTGGGGRAEGEGLQFCRHLCMAPLSVFHVLSRALRPHEELSRVFPRTSFPLFYIFMVFVLSPLPPPPPPPLRKVARARYKQSFCFYQDKLSSAWVLPLGVQVSLCSFLTCAVTPSHHHHGVAALSSVRELSI